MRNGNRCMGGWLRGKLKGCGYKMTLAREAILDVIVKNNDHLSAEDIYLKVMSSFPGVGLATIYRTLEILVCRQILYKFDFGDGVARYELAESKDFKGSKGHHHHLVCTKCSKVVDYTDFIDKEVKLLNETEEELSKKYNFNITNHFIQFYGLCERCRSKR